MKMKITVAPSTLPGTYKMTIKAVNIGNYSKLGNLTFDAYINVTNDVFSFVVTPHPPCGGTRAACGHKDNDQQHGRIRRSFPDKRLWAARLECAV